jgi:hypothetical protein
MIAFGAAFIFVSPLAIDRARGEIKINFLGNQ